MYTDLYSTAHFSEPTPMDVDCAAQATNCMPTTHEGFRISVKGPSVSTNSGVVPRELIQSEVKNLFLRKVNTTYPFKPADSSDVSTQTVKVLSFSNSSLDPTFIEAEIVEKDVESHVMDKMRKLYQDRISAHEAIKTLINEEGMKGSWESHIELMHSSPDDCFSDGVYYTHSQAPGVKEYLSVALQKFENKNGFNPFCILLGQRSVPFVINSEEVEKAGGIIFSILENFLRYSCTSPTECDKRMLYGNEITNLLKEVMNSGNQQDLAELEKVIPFSKLYLFINTDLEHHGESGKHKVTIENDSHIFDSKLLNSLAGSSGGFKIDDQDLAGYAEIDNAKDLAKFLEKGLRVTACREFNGEIGCFNLLKFALESNISTVYNKIRLACNKITVNTSAADDKNHVYLGDTFDANIRTNSQYLVVDEAVFKDYVQKTTHAISNACDSLGNIIKKHSLPTKTSDKTAPDVDAANPELVELSHSLSDSIQDCNSQLLVHCRKTNPENRIQTTFSNIDSINIPAKRFLIINKSLLHYFFKNKQAQICARKISEVEHVHSCRIPIRPAFSPYTVCKRVESDSRMMLHTRNPHAAAKIKPGTETSVNAKFTQRAKLFPYFSETTERAEVDMTCCSSYGGGIRDHRKLTVKFSSSEKPKCDGLQFLGTVLQDSNSGALRNSITMNTDKEAATFCDTLDEAETEAARMDSLEDNYSIYVKGKRNDNCQKLVSNHFPFGLNYDLKLDYRYS